MVRLQWDWEVPIPELETSVFVVPREIVKNNEDRLIVLNRVASAVVDDVRGEHPTRVFTWKGRPVQRLGTASWIGAEVERQVPGAARPQRLGDFFLRRGAGIGRDAVEDPQAIGLLGQMLLLPLAAFGLAVVMQLPPEIAVGLIIIALALKHIRVKVLEGEQVFRRVIRLARNSDHGFIPQTESFFEVLPLPVAVIIIVQQNAEVPVVADH